MIARPDARRGRLDEHERLCAWRCPKGALYDERVALLARAGVRRRGARRPGPPAARATADFEFIIARPTDIPVYIAYGGVDVAIAGADVLVEAGLERVELLDLGFGGCRFVVAEPEEPRARSTSDCATSACMRVATKYPRITEDATSPARQQVEIVKLHGNIELAPLIGLVDRIVDITATGTTLRRERPARSSTTCSRRPRGSSRTRCRLQDPTARG